MSARLLNWQKQSAAKRRSKQDLQGTGADRIFRPAPDVFLRGLSGEEGEKAARLRPRVCLSLPCSFFSFMRTNFQRKRFDPHFLIFPLAIDYRRDCAASVARLFLHGQKETKKPSEAVRRGKAHAAKAAASANPIVPASCQTQSPPAPPRRGLAHTAAFAVQAGLPHCGKPICFPCRPALGKISISSPLKPRIKTTKRAVRGPL